MKEENETIPVIEEKPDETKVIEIVEDCVVIAECVVEQPQPQTWHGVVIDDELPRPCRHKPAGP